MEDTRPTREARRCILCIDRGSSSLKAAVYALEAQTEHLSEQLLIEGAVESLESAGAALRVSDYRGRAHETTLPLDGRTPIAAVLAATRDAGVQIDAVGHRLVYGGLEHETPARVTPDLLTSLTALIPFDPLHMPFAIAAVREIEAAFPDLPQVVCFDTAFHRSMPAVAQRLPLPRELWSQGVRRYGFHGLSYESILRELGPAAARGRLIVAHLGSGASLAAMRDGQPIDTTMGFSPLGGLMMGTRPGDLDPGALLYLLRQGRYSSKELDDLISQRSGLLGVSQISPDMRTLLDARSTDPRAAEAVELYVYGARKHFGALATVLGGLDSVVFTGGVGERSATIRWEISAGLGHLGVELDAARNLAGAPVVSVDGARVVVRVMPPKENLMIARHTFATLFAAPHDATGG